MMLADLYANSCGRKIGHATKELAEAALKSLKKSTRTRRKTTLTVYPCRFGNHWHVGHNRRGR